MFVLCWENTSKQPSLQLVHGDADHDFKHMYSFVLILVLFRETLCHDTEQGYLIAYIKQDFTEKDLSENDK